MKTFNQFMHEALGASSLGGPITAPKPQPATTALNPNVNKVSADINSTSQQLKRTTPVNKPTFTNSQSEPTAPTNAVPALTSAVQKIPGAGRIATTALKATSDVASRLLGR